MSKPSKEFLENCTYLVDASSYIFRAYYGMQAELKAPDGTPTHATYAFYQMIENLINEQKAKRFALIWDRKEKGFRNDIFPAYKANRDAPPEDLSLQIENSQKLMELQGYPQLSLAGYEADDLIASAVKKNPNENFVIVTADKDLLQLVGPKVWWWDTLRKKWANIEGAEEKFGVGPEQIAEVQALSGDSVDNIPGAPGIGPKTATALIKEFGSLEVLLKEAQKRWKDPASYKKSPGQLKGKKLESLATNIEKIELSLKLVSLYDEAPIDLDIKTFHPGKLQEKSLLDFAKRLNFKRVVEKIGSLQSSEESSVLVPRDERYNFHLIKDLKHLKAILKEHDDAAVMAFDTETHSLNSRAKDNIVGLSFAFNTAEGYYLPFAHKDAENLPIDETLNTFFAYWSEKDSLDLIFQNAKFDLHVLAAQGILIPENLIIQDTMVASFVLDPTEKHGMDAMAQKYLDNYETLKFSDLVKKGETFADVPIAKATAYAAEDACVTLELWDILSHKLRGEEKLWKIYTHLDRPLVRLLFEMEEVGVAIDSAYLANLSKEFHKAVEDCKSAAFQILSDYDVVLDPKTLNLGSTKQIAKLLFEDLKLPILKKGKTGPSTDAGVLEELSHQHPFPKKLMEYRELTKLLSTYVDALPKLVDPDTGNLHTDLSQTIAQTGRLASSNPNLQNIPIRTLQGQRIRKAFKARKGFKLLGVDYSQIELRVLAHVSGEANLIKAFQEDADIHRRTASLIFQKPEATISEEERRAAKTINFGIIYGQTAFGLSKTLKISRSDAQTFIDNYFRCYPQIQDYMDHAISKAYETGYAETFIGRRRRLADIQSKNAILKKFAERMAINSPLQGSAADLMKAAMIRVRETLLEKSFEAKFILQVHDELIFEAPESEIEALKKCVVDILESPDLLKDFGIKSFKVKMKAVAEVASDWGEL